MLIVKINIQLLRWMVWLSKTYKSFSRIHPAARLPLIFQPSLHHGLQNRSPDVSGGGVGKGEGEAEVAEGHVREDDSRCQFHQHFTCTFFLRKCFCSFSLATVWLCSFLAKEYWHKICL